MNSSFPSTSTPPWFKPAVGYPPVGDGFSLRTPFLASLLLLAAVLWRRLRPVKQAKDNLPTAIGGFSSFVPLVKFLQRPEEFLQRGFRQTKENIWQFRHIFRPVIVLSGHSARDSLFGEKDYSLVQGIQLISFLPPIPGISVNVNVDDYNTILKRASTVQRTESLNVILPHTVKDCCRSMEQWGQLGNYFDPFGKVNELVFHMNLRSLTCEELTDDPIVSRRLNELFDGLNYPQTIEGQHFSWLPTWNNLRRLWRTKAIYETMVKVVHERQATGLRREDTLQMLIDFGDSELIIMGVLMGMMLAGTKAMGRVAIWMTSYLASDPDLRQKIFGEINSLVESNSGDRLSPSESLSSQLSRISAEEWEAQTPILDSVITETLRLAQPQFAIRRNLGPDRYIDEKLVPKDAYLIYAYSDIHLDPEVYPDPFKFRPGRQIPKNLPYADLSWGGGRTMCAGRRIAKLQLKIAAASFVVGFDSSIVHRQGATMSLPRPNWNDANAKPDEEFFIKLERSNFAF